MSFGQLQYQSKRAQKKQKKNILYLVVLIRVEFSAIALDAARSV
jgi:hypothetical protein